MAGGIPKWITKAPEDEEYLYVVGIKTGAQTLEEGKRSAINQAVTELTEHFGVRSRTMYRERKTELETRLVDEIGSRSGDISLKGLLLKDWHFEKTHKGFDTYVLVQYPRAELENEKTRIQNVIAVKTSSVRRLLKRGADAWNKGDVKAAYQTFATALRDADDMEDEGLRREAFEGLREIFYNIEIMTISGGQQTIAPFRKLKEPLVAKAFVRSGGIELPIKGFPILFLASGYKGQEDVIFTDENGFASYRGFKVRRPLVVIASFDPAGFLPYGVITGEDKKTIDSYIEALGQKKAVFNVKPVIEKKNTRISISIAGEGSADASAVEGSIAAGFVNAGYDVIVTTEDVRMDISVTGSIRSRKGGSNMGWTYSSNADGFIKALDLSTGKVLTQKNLTATGFGETDALAEANAFKMLGEEIAEQLLEEMVEGGD